MGVGSLVLFAGALTGQPGERPSTLNIVRQQFGSIADQACDSVKLAPASGVALAVVAAKDRNLVENAFVGALQRKGVKSWLAKDRDSSEVVVTVSVLTDKVGFEQLQHDMYARTVWTELEVRADFRSDRPAQDVGIFSRTMRDTVSQQETEQYARFGGSVPDEESTVFQRLLAPLVVLGCGIIVVYLFFTVRS